MTLKDIAAQLTTAVQTVPNLVQILRDGLEQAEAGSDVEVTQVVSSGTKIASVKVGEETTDLYAPASPDYSTTEYDTGRKWIDGSTIYGKVLPTGAVSFTKFEWTTLYTDESISSISQLIDARIIQPANKGAYCAFNFKADGTSIKGLYLETLSLSNGSYVVIEYLKTAE